MLIVMKILYMKGDVYFIEYLAFTDNLFFIQEIPIYCATNNKLQHPSRCVMITTLEARGPELVSAPWSLA